jgi:hypothetical protein
VEFRKEVAERFPLANSLLANLRFQSTAEPDSKFLATQLMTAHDAAELVLTASAINVEFCLGRTSTI